MKTRIVESLGMQMAKQFAKSRVVTKGISGHAKDRLTARNQRRLAKKKSLAGSDASVQPRPQGEVK